MKLKNSAEQIEANLQMLMDASTKVNEQKPMYLYIDKKTGRQIKSELPLKEFLAHLKEFKKNNKR